MLSKSKWSSVLFAVALLVGLAVPGSAQDVTFDASGGVSVPISDLADMADPGPAFNVAIGKSVHERVEIRIKGGGVLLPPADFPTGQDGPQMDFFRYGLEGLFHVLDSDRQLSVDLTVGGGGSVLVTSEQPVSRGSEVRVIDLSSHYLGASAGLRVGYDIAPQAEVFLGGTSYWTFADEEDLADFEFLDPSLTDVSTLWDIPVEVGFSFNF